MSRSGVVVVGVLFALLLIGGRDRDPTEVEARFVPAPTQVESEVGPLAVPLAISETTPPPGWDPPDTAEEQIADGLRDVGRLALGQLAFAIAGVIVVLGLMYYAERRRAR